MGFGTARIGIANLLVQFMQDKGLTSELENSPVARQRRTASRKLQPAAEGAVVEIREVGGLHHHYERRAA